MGVPVFEDVNDEAEEEKTGEEENEDTVFFKPVIEDLSMELARKCTKLISDVSGLSNFCLPLHCVYGTIMSQNHRVGDEH
uniref:nebulette-like n=1 Tax=Panthera onca TaxID=9690 RepID=UPI002955C1AC|nr:nebulette-like [Panthera onca]